MSRRRFDPFHGELSLAADIALPRYPLWLAFHELGLDPETLTVADLNDFLDFRVPSWLREKGIRVPTERRLVRLRRSIERYDPSLRTPEEQFAALAGS